MMDGFPTRARAWSRLNDGWQVIVIGGGITGAGIFQQCARAGLRTLLVEAHDFASGTSSRSSKLVHGGLRYLNNLQFAMTFSAVRERQLLLDESHGLVKPLPFLFPLFEEGPPTWMVGLGLTIFDLMAFQWQHRQLSAEAAVQSCPPLRARGLKSAYLYQDAQVDDARLVLRVIQEGLQAGGTALNYVGVERLLRGTDGAVNGARLTDGLDPDSRHMEVTADLVINATGVWADGLRADVDRPARLRPLRGSHLVFPRERFELDLAVTVIHPHDRRPLFAIPWEGVTLFGTTDLDLTGPIRTNLGIRQVEKDYLFAALKHTFPDLKLRPEDAVSSFAGIRSVIGTGAPDPSEESREHAIWDESGLLTVTGGKLTTFRKMAIEALDSFRGKLTTATRSAGQGPLFEPPPLRNPRPDDLDHTGWARLRSRFGRWAERVAACAGEGECQPVGDLPTRWVEVRWAARAEAVVHLEDLLLRRTRLGLQMAQGARALLPKIRSIAQPELGWSDERWKQEVGAYTRVWSNFHAP